MVTAGVLLWWPEGLSINTKSILFFDFYFMSLIFHEYKKSAVEMHNGLQSNRIQIV